MSKTLPPFTGEVILVRPTGHQKPTAGVLLQIWSDQIAYDATGKPYGTPPHMVGRGEVLEDGRVALRFPDARACRDAAALVREGMVDVSYEGDRPVIMLRA
jgi:hypothetical protein